MSPRSAGQCFHCGEPVPTGPPIWANLGNLQQPMCCFGCKAVAEFIHDSALDAYYEHRRPPTSGLRAQQTDWSVFDGDDLQQRYLHRVGDTAEVAIDIGGMYCSACAWLLETGLARLDAVQDVALNAATRRAIVTWDAGRLDFSGLLAAIAALGFKPAPAVHGAEDAAGELEQRRALRRLIVAAAAGMQVMMFAVALYAGAHFGIEGRIEQFLRVISLFVCLPIVFYSARPFFAGALRGVRSRRPGMDLPVALAIGAAFAASAWATLAGEGEIYFDSVAMFVLFLGGARYLEMRARQRAEDGARAMAELLPEMATRLSGDLPEVVSVDRLRVGDRILIRPGDVMPADGHVLSGTLSLDEALLTGEAMPVERTVGAEVAAGAINRAGTGAVELTRVGASTSVAEIGRLIDRAKADRPPVALLADRIAGRFVLAVLAIASVAGLVWFRVDSQRAFEVILATLVVTCPCALSLATPASLAAAASRLGQHGILLVRARILDVFATPLRVVFDKTGTLTEGRPTVTAVRTAGRDSAADCLAIAAALESVSEHVLARAFVAPAGARQLPASDATVVTGCGVEGRVGGRRLRLGRRDFVAGLHDLPDESAPGGVDSLVYLGDQDGLLARFSIGDALRDDAGEALQALRDLGHDLAIASGDRRPAVAAVARRLGVDEWRAGLDPAGKLQYLADLQSGGSRVVMVGDGINDSPVLAAANASIAIDAGTALARASADAVVPGQRLASVVQVAEVARRTRRVIAQNVTWAIGYNLCAVPLAVSGMLAPWMAAIGMSLSSLLVVGNALRLQRAPQPDLRPRTERRDNEQTREARS